MGDVAITGDTYPHRETLKALGGRWAAEHKAWMVPAGRAAEAAALAGVTVVRPVYVMTGRGGRGEAIRSEHASEREALEAAVAPGLAASPAGTVAEYGDGAVTIRFADGGQLELPIVRGARSVTLQRGGAVMATITSVVPGERAARPARRSRYDGMSRADWIREEGGEG